MPEVVCVSATSDSANADQERIFSVPGAKKCEPRRGHEQFKATRKPAYYLRMGYLAGLGRPSARIAEEMGDGIDPGYVRVALQRAGIGPGDRVWCQVPLTPKQRMWLNHRAERAGKSPEALLQDLIAEAVMPKG